MNNYDMPAIRKELITKLSAGLKKDSKWWKDDYEAIVKAVNKKTRKELLEALGRWTAVASVTQKEINTNCQFK